MNRHRVVLVTYLVGLILSAGVIAIELVPATYAGTTIALTIVGHGQAMTIIEAMPGFGDRVFHILDTGAAGDEARFERLTIGNGDVLNTDNGGGILNANASLLAVVSPTGTLTLTGSTLTENSSGLDGGIFNGGGQMTIGASTLDNNVANNGGGIYSSGTLTMTNSTLSQNQALAGDGGGIYNAGSSASMATLTNTTLTLNEAALNGGGLYNDSSTVTLINTIVAENTPGGDCFNNAGSITDAGHNLDGDATCGLGALSISAGDASLGPLQNNGGSTQTHALLDDSQAIDMGSNSACPATDQRGVARPADGDNDGVAICDIGAFELVIYTIYAPIIISNSCHAPIHRFIGCIP